MVAVLMAHFPFGDLFSCDFCAGISVVFVLAVFAFVLFLVLHARAVLKSVPTKIYAHMRMDCTCVMLNIFKSNSYLSQRNHFAAAGNRLWTT